VPQLKLSKSKLDSQPSLGARLQSPKFVVQEETLHWPFTQVGMALAREQVRPQFPQLEVSVRRSVQMGPGQVSGRGEAQVLPAEVVDEVLEVEEEEQGAVMLEGGVVSLSVFSGV
jgi:hypothetical protein